MSIKLKAKKVIFKPMKINGKQIMRNLVNVTPLIQFAILNSHLIARLLSFPRCHYQFQQQWSEYSFIRVKFLNLS